MTKITYLGHSAFKIEADNGYTLVLDPYQKGSVPGVELPDDLSADEVHCSHTHYDHGAVERVTLLKRGISCPFTKETITVPHDDEGGAKRGMNDILILTDGTEKIVHFGDIGRMLTDEEAQKLSDADIVMIPCGGFYTIDAAVAKQIVDRIQPKLTILMHFRNDQAGFEVIEHINNIQHVFTDLKQLSVNMIEVGQETGVITLAVC